MRHLRVSALVALVAALATLMLVFAPVSAAAQPAAGTAATTIPINVTTPIASFVGNLDINQFAVQNGQVVALGTLTGTLTNLITGVTQTVTQDVVLPLLSATGSCTILHLELGPLDVNLLGVMIHLDKVVLDISAQAGPGNLLGNLLCGVANALNGNAVGNAIANILNTVLRLLG
jgi:hypothetical protein